MTYLGARTRPIESEAKQWFSIFQIRTTPAERAPDGAEPDEDGPRSDPQTSSSNSSPQGAQGTDHAPADTMPP